MNPFFHNMRPWWWAFLITWVIVAAGLRSGGMDGNAAARVALVAGALAALLVWAVVRVRGRMRDG